MKERWNLIILGLCIIFLKIKFETVKEKFLTGSKMNKKWLSRDILGLYGDYTKLNNKSGDEKRISTWIIVNKIMRLIYCQ